jgi:hypothetical protein
MIDNITTLSITKTSITGLIVTLNIMIDSITILSITGLIMTPSTIIPSINNTQH